MTFIVVSVVNLNYIISYNHVNYEYLANSNSYLIKQNNCYNIIIKYITQSYFVKYLTLIVNFK